MSSSTKSSALTATAGSVVFSILTSACIMLSECSRSLIVSSPSSVSASECASICKSVIAPRRSPPLLRASVLSTISSAFIFSLSSIFCSAGIIAVMLIEGNSTNTLFVLMLLNLLSQGSFAIIIIGNFDSFIRSASADTPPLSSLPAIPSSSSMRMSLLWQNRLCCFIAFPIFVFISAAFLWSDAFTSISSSASFFASACIAAVFPVPVGPCIRSAFFFCLE